MIQSASPFGRTEKELLEMASCAVRFLCAAEREARLWSCGGERAGLAADEVWRALGILQNARSISCEESMSKISSALYGLAAGMELPVKKQILLQLLVDTKPAHIALLCRDENASPAERDIRRATLIRTALGALPPIATSQQQ